MITDIEQAKQRLAKAISNTTDTLDRAVNEVVARRIFTEYEAREICGNYAPPAPELPVFDTMNHMLAMQCEFNARLGHVAHGMEDNQTRSEWLCKYLLAMRQEIAEATDWLPWKWWSNRTGNKQVAPADMWSEDHIDELKTELIDIQHFLNCCYLELGMDYQEIHARYKHKMEVNHARQDAEGY